MRKIDRIIIHCSATQPGADIGAAEIKKWHVNGNGWDDIGYHRVIRRDGTLENGRPLDKPGAHCKGYNANSIGICLVGGVDVLGNAEDNFTPAQWVELEAIVKELCRKFPNATVHGHNEFAAKTCPCFNVKTWWRVASSK